MRCISTRCASLLAGPSDAPPRQRRAQSVAEASSRGTNHRSEIGSYHLPISISTTSNRFALFRLARGHGAVAQGMLRRHRGRVRTALCNATRCRPERSCRRSAGSGPHSFLMGAAKAGRRARIRRLAVKACPRRLAGTGICVGIAREITPIELSPPARAGYPSAYCRHYRGEF